LRESTGSAIGIQGASVKEREMIRHYNRADAAPLFSRRVPIWTALAMALLAGTAGAQAQDCQPWQLTSPGGVAGDQFGTSVAVSADTMVVGAADAGAAFVYRWTGASWFLEATLTGDGAPGDAFGFGAAIDGDTVVIGAPNHDQDAGVDRGSAYVFVRTGTVWALQAMLAAADGAAGDTFGAAVSLSGNTAVIGAPDDDSGANADQGSAYVFVRSGSTWTQQAKVAASDGAAGDHLGGSVAVFDGTAIIGAAGGDIAGNADQGAAYVFIRSGGGWTQQAKLTAPDGAAGDSFGASVETSSDTAVIGAASDGVGGNASQGSAYVFARSGTDWTEQTQLTAFGGAAGDAFGASIKLDGDSIVIGAPFRAGGRGAAFVFGRASGEWVQRAELLAPDGAAGDRFGSAVALSSDTCLVGAPLDAVGGNATQGSAWAFTRVADEWVVPTLELIASDGTANDRMGRAVAVSGDTMLIGAYTDDNGPVADQGSAYVFRRSGSTWVQEARLVASDGAAGDFFGISVAIEGDTAVVGSYSDDIGATLNRGSVYVFTRTDGQWTQQAKIVAADGAADDFFGFSVALSGDLLAVGSYLDNVTLTDQGSVYLFRGAGSAWTQEARLVAADAAASDQFGISVDVDNGTVVVGSWFDDTGTNTNRGSAYVFVRYDGVWIQQAKLEAADGLANDQFGNIVAISGDTIAVGADLDDVGSVANQGSVHIFTRSGTTWTEQAFLTAPDGSANDQFGYWLDLSGDDLVVGANLDDIGTVVDQGSAHLYRRAGSVWTHRARLLAFDGATGDQFGSVVAISGNAVVVGAPWHNIGASADQGTAYCMLLPAQCFPLAHNDTLDISYPALDAALLHAQSGNILSASPAAFAGIASLDTLGRSLGIRSTGAIRTPAASILAVGGSSFLETADAAPAEFYGDLRLSSGASADIFAGSFRLGSGAVLTARTGGSLGIFSPVSRLDGQTRLEQDAAIAFAGAVDAIGPLSAGSGFTMVADGPITNLDTWSVSSGQMTAPEYVNRAVTNIFGSTAIFGDFTNDAGALTTIRSGTLFVFGSLTNDGTIIGEICDNCSGGPPNLDIAGGLTAGRDAGVRMAFPGSVVRVGAGFDCAATDNSRFDLAVATLRMEGAGPEQAFELMSTDVGRARSGLDRSLPGHFPIGVVQIGPAPSTVVLVDARDNDSSGQSAREALYVDELHIYPGSRLINPDYRIYYNSLINDGSVEVPANLVRICAGDFNGDGSVTSQDFFDFLNAFFDGTAVGDFNADGFINSQDFFDFLAAFFVGC
jgi:hypothetical protein